MSSALIVIGGAVYIGLSIAFRFTPRLRVVAGLIVGGLLAGVVAEQVTTWLGKGVGALAHPLGQFIGQGDETTAAAIPGAVSLGLAIVVAVFLRRKGGGGKSTVGAKGGGGGKGGLAHAALACAVLLPLVAFSVAEAVRSVTR